MLARNWEKRFQFRKGLLLSGNGGKWVRVIKKRALVSMKLSKKGSWCQEAAVIKKLRERGSSWQETGEKRVPVKKLRRRGSC